MTLISPSYLISRLQDRDWLPLMKLNYLRLMPRKDFQVWTILQQMAVTEQKLTLLNKIVLVTPELRTLVPRPTKRPSSSPTLVSVCIAPEFIGHGGNILNLGLWAHWTRGINPLPSGWINQKATVRLRLRATSHSPCLIAHNQFYFILGVVTLSLVSARSWAWQLISSADVYTSILNRLAVLLVFPRKQM